jgi:hypothetical protein
MGTRVFGRGATSRSSSRRGLSAARRRAITLAAATLAVLLAGVWLLAGAVLASSTNPRASAARTVSLNENGNLHSTERHPTINALNEQGSATGTIAGTIYIHLHVVSNSKVTAEVNIYPRGGSLSGTGSASYHVVGAQAQFVGTLSITRGSGTYSRARASRLVFTGAIQRRSDAVTVHLSGPLSY